MPHFSSWEAFQKFRGIVRKERRFGHTPACIEFLEAVKASASERIVTLPKGFPLWRAQIGHDWQDELVYEGEKEGEDVWDQVPTAHDAERMKPDPAKVGEGRLNPRGIAMLYLARMAETAVAEVRPWVGAAVSVGVFEVLHDCALVDCSKPGGGGLRLSIDANGTFLPPEPEEWDTLVWEAISSAFARPTDPHDTSLAYAPTQILAEVLREAGHDGILYRSALHVEGTNVALFERSAARLFACRLYDITKVEYTSSDTGRGYSLERETTMPTPQDATSST